MAATHLSGDRPFRKSPLFHWKSSSVENRYMSNAIGGLTFGARNEAYQAFRISYPPYLFEIIERAAPNMRRTLAIDLGSGTGISTRPLLQRFDHVLAIEPDARMAEKIKPDARLEVRVSSSESLEAEPGSVDLVTSGTALYWMDGPKIIERMANWLHPDGEVAIYRYALPVLPSSLAEVIDREFACHWNAFRSPRLLDEDYSWRCFRETSHFRTKDMQMVSNQAIMNWRTFVGFFGSTSYVGAYLRSISASDDYTKAFEDEVRTVIGEAPFTVDFPTELILAAQPHP
ncbi:MAG: class I SAM-dependent methyltransferase [Gammaproteobacteria bacterium]|nr:class I SAM-dependent methyltransferase [Gammaproteobacteria bacterium]